MEYRIMERLKVAHNEKDYKIQSELYPVIAQGYLEKRDYISAITIYNFAFGAYNKWKKYLLVRNFSHPCDISVETKKEILEGISISEQAYLSSIGIDARLNKFPYKKVFCLHQEYLADLRRQVSEQLLSTLRPLSIEKIYENIAYSIKEFIGVLTYECIQVLGNPPCPCALVGLGSLARNEATPYSDLEFAIFINDINYKDYFRKLATLINIKILNIGETSPKIAYVEPELFSFSFDYEKNPVQKGFAFDSKDPSGCKTPLGNFHLKIPDREKFELIDTPENTLKYQSEYWYKVNRHLPIILQNVTFIFGEIQLFNRYQVLIQEYVAPWVRQSRAKQLLLGDVMKFEPRVGKLEKKERVFPVKYDLYRLPNLVFDALALYYGLSSTSTYDRISELKIKNLLNASAAQRLEYCFDKISKLRLQNYFEAGEQSDNLAVDANQHEKLYEIYEILIYLLDCAYDFAANGKNRFKSHDFKTDSSLAKIRVYEKLLDYDKVIKICQDMLNDFPTNSDQNIDNENWITIVNRLGLAYSHQDRFAEAASTFGQLIERNIQHINPALHVNYAYVLDELGRYEKALKQLSLAEQAFNDPDNISPNITAVDKIHSAAEIFSQYGVTLQHTGQYKKAVDYLYKAVDQELSVFNGITTPSLFRYQNNLAIGLMEIGEFEEAYALYDKFIANIKNQLGTFHPMVANGLYNKAEAFFRQGRYQKALECGEEALQIYLLEENNEHNSELGLLFHSMASIYVELGNNESAFKYIDLSLTINAKIYDKNHKATILSYLTAMRVYNEAKAEEKSISLFNTISELSYLKKDLDLQAQLYIQVSDSFLHLANTENKKQNLKKALDYAQKAIDIADSLFQKEFCVKHLRNFAYYLDNKGTILIALKEYKAAEKCFKESLEKLKGFFKDYKHPCMVICCLNIGKLYMQKYCTSHDLHVALDYFGKALKIQKELYENDKHRSWFEIYELISYAFYWLGELDEALYYVQKSREIGAQFNLKREETSEKLFQNTVKEQIVRNPSLYWSFPSNRLKRTANEKLIENIRKIDSYSIKSVI